MIEWHKEYVKNTLKFFGWSNYQGMWLSYLKGFITGGLIVYFLF